MRLVLSFGVRAFVALAESRLCDKMISYEIGNANDKHFSVDGTGDPCTMKVNYESIPADSAQ